MRKGVLLVMGLGILLIAGSLWLFVEPVLIVNRTESVPKGLYIIQETPLERGQLVAYRPTQAEDEWLAQHEITPGSWPLLKRIVALEGDEVCWDDSEVYVNGELRANRIDGVKFGLLDGCVFLGADQVFLLNKHPLSVDGRYFGIQDVHRIIGTVRGLWVSDNAAETVKPGEELVSVSAGDTVRWVVGDTRSGSGATSRAHVLVKPHSSGLTTNLMIATDRRTYYLEVESTDAAYLAALSWRYPGDELEQIKANYAARSAQAENTIAPVIALDQMSFDYRISGDDPDWRPIRAFDDGRQVFIQMPESIGETDMPPLFVMGGSGDAELVNYRVRGRYYVVDQLFDAAELRQGARSQDVVRISRAPARRNLFQEIFGD